MPAFSASSSCDRPTRRRCVRTRSPNTRTSVAEGLRPPGRSTVPDAGRRSPQPTGYREVPVTCRSRTSPARRPAATVSNIRRGIEPGCPGTTGACRGTPVTVREAPPRRQCRAGSIGGGLMRVSKRWTTAVLAVGIVVALLPLRSASALGPDEGAGPPTTVPGLAAGAPEHTVTLITGDRVSVVDRGGRLEPVRIEPGPGRLRVTFAASAAGGRLRVTPSDALPLLRAGQVDPRLFDVTALVEFGYDDSRADLPLIVTGTGAGTGVAALRAVPGGTAFHAPKKGIEAVWRNLSGGTGLRAASASKLWLDGLLKPVLTESVPQVGAPAAWAAGFTGDGVKVGVVDSGIDATHPDLAGRVVAARNFHEDGDDRDLTGHGTHVAATIAGIGADGAHKGVALGAKLVSARVCNPDGCPESAILDGMQWVAGQGVRVINMSLGGTDTEGRDLLEEAVDRITAQSGVLFVIAAGNSGEEGDGTVGTPGSADSALTVGAVTKTDELAGFSSRGPRLGDGALKPDITAPGVSIVAAFSKDAVEPPRDPRPGGRAALSGTSMATPHVAGGAAVLAQRHPDWKPAQLKSALMGSAKTSPDIQVYAQGAGGLDLARGIKQTVTAEPASFSVQDLWPHDKNPVTRTVTYRNTGTNPVTLALDMRTAAPAGMFTVSRRSVTVPAGGTAEVKVSIRTDVRGVATRNGAYLVATGGDQVITTPLAAVVETEATFEMKVTHVDRDGGPARSVKSAIVDLEHDRLFTTEVSTTDRLRLPKGRYIIMTFFDTQPGNLFTLLINPLVVLDRDVAVTMDARAGRPVSVRVPQPDAKDFRSSLFTQAVGPFGLGNLIAHPDTSIGHLFLGTVGTVRQNPAVESGFSALFAKQGVAPADSPYLTSVAWRERGRIFPGLNRTVSARDLATIRTEYAHQAMPVGTMEYHALWPERTFDLIDFAPTRFPSSRVEHFHTDAGVQGGMFLRGDVIRLGPTLLNDSLSRADFPTNLKRPRLPLDRDGKRIFHRTGNDL